MLQHKRDHANHPGERQEQGRVIGVGARLFAELKSLGRQAGDLVVRRRRNRNKRLDQLRLLRESELFDADWYLATYPDVASARIDPALHFLVSGWREGRNPGPRFGTTPYLRRNPDVAALDINPLIHFIEHGSFEGREIDEMADIPWGGRKSRQSRVALRPAVPVFRTSRAAKQMRPWHRACNLAADAEAIEISGLAVAILASQEDRSTAELILDDFVRFSDGSLQVLAVPPALGDLPDLEDCWFAAGKRLVTRWRAAEPTVIRAVQYDPVVKGLALVGEGLAQAAIDPIQFDLASSAMPVLLLATSAQGELRGIGRLAFPSLARGGLHYPELVNGLASGNGGDLMATSNGYEASLRKLRSGKRKAVIKEIELDLAGATGTEPMFRSDLRQLLERVLLIDVAAAADFQPRASSYLSNAARISAAQAIRSEGANLRLAADMMPGLQSLVALDEGRSEPALEPRCELIVSDVDQAQPAVKFSLPSVNAITHNIRSKFYPLAVPLMRDAIPNFVPLAIRVSARQLDDAEFLAPDLSLQPGENVATQSICWIVDWDDANELLLAQSLTALDLQRGIGTQSLCFLRPPTALVRAVAESAFEGRWKFARDINKGIDSADFDLIGYLGNGVVLHDERTAALLATFLAGPEVSSASCAMVSSFRHGKSWRPLLIEEGHLPVDLRLSFGGARASPAEMIWRASYSVVQPSSHLWVASIGSVRRWLGQEPARDELHIMTSTIAASLEASARTERKAHPFPAVPASEDRSVKLQVLVG